MPWMDVSAQISSLGTRMEELALVSDTRFYSMKDHIDQYQTGFTFCFEHFQQIFERVRGAYGSIAGYIQASPAEY
ncbi:hypothetical protein CK203_106964 [Vitis vinifera]|uniref:Uncharacterized protein n=1 Tax=Vitis vinifera TaxID=29760 RepID=A0A438BPK7_VITVI|nr:hypothetical protein CK203_106964 [Vitis vinifera]